MTSSQQVDSGQPLWFLLGNLKGEEGAAERTVEDVFLRKFMFGTFHGCLANEIVIKRRGNMLIICALMLQRLPPQKFYFLIGYSESLLSHFYKCPVKLEIQTLQDRAVYKYVWTVKWWQVQHSRNSWFKATDVHPFIITASELVESSFWYQQIKWP